jgi:hypothetical protein
VNAVIARRTRPRALGTAAGVGLVWLAGLTGCTYAIRAFDVEPHVICQGETVQVKWDVGGPARLRAERGPNDWEEGDVAEVGSRKIVPAATTKLTLTALRANPGKSGHQGNKDITVIPANEPPSRKLASATCDAAGHCRATFTLQAPGGRLQAKRLSSPLSRRAGVSTPTQICANHAGLQGPVCVAPGQTADVSVTADGEWTLEADVSGATASSPPPDLSLEIQLGCS